MYCVIQEIEVKKVNGYGACKEIIAYQYDWAIGDKPKQWAYRCSIERFERPIKKAYKISIHRSYREDGKVKKKQYNLCTINYYSVAEGGIYDYINDDFIKRLSKELEVTEEYLWDIINNKFEQLKENIIKEFELTEEYKAKQDQDIITTIHIANKIDFEEKHGKNTYDYCYDVFGSLRNEDYLNKVKADWEAQQKYNRSYQENKHSNYEYNKYSGYQESKHSNHKEEDKVMFKKFYLTLAKNYHPDITKDGGEAMKLINSLKEEWGL